MKSRLGTLTPQFASSANLIGDKVLGVDAKAKRIALSIKALTGPPSRPATKPGKPTSMHPPTRDEKFAAFLEKWNARKG